MRKVVITTVATQTDEYGEKSRIELFTVGTCHEKNGVCYITYRESEITGMEGTTTLLKIYADFFAVTRMGAVEQSLEFRLGQQSTSTYITPFGTFTMSVFTERLEIAIAKGLGCLSAAYELDFNGHWQSSNTLLVSIREEEQA